MKKRLRAKGIGRREALQRLVAGAGASAALPALAPATTTPETGMPGIRMPASESLGSAEPPDPALSAKDWKPKFFDAHQNETIVVLSDLLIPDTDTQGAKAAQVNRFIDLYLSAADPEFQKEFLQGLAWLQGYCLSHYTQPFTQLEPERQKEVLTLLTHESKDAQIAEEVKHFRILKEAIALSYYTSEIGMLQELKYQTSPFQPEFPGCKNPDEH
jgi:glucoside 3-dehydrogenase (cytochrome c) hitch-hiker subunit